MGIPIAIPASVPYNGSLQGYPTKFLKKAPEGPKVVSLQIDFAVNGGPNNCVAVNLNVLNVPPLSQIAAIWVDNSSNNFATEIVFQDTGFRVTVPPLTGEFHPVLTNYLSFVVFNQGKATGKSICNIFVMNEHIDGFANNENIPGVNYVIDSNGNIVPLLVGDLYQFTQMLALTSGLHSVNLIDAGVYPNWSLIQFEINAVVSAGTGGSVGIGDGSALVGDVIFGATIETASVPFMKDYQVSGIQLQSKHGPTTNLVSVVNVDAASTMTVYYNIYFSTA